MAPGIPNFILRMDRLSDLLREANSDNTALKAQVEYLKETLKREREKVSILRSKLLCHHCWFDSKRQEKFFPGETVMLCERCTLELVALDESLNGLDGTSMEQ